jgi:hypothetical protein
MPLGPISFFLIKKKESRACEPMNTAKNNKQQMNKIKACLFSCLPAGRQEHPHQKF